mmetsp:Transcript_14317/g.22350  ORF Transcript_14317/g.22350 Transcript_14317/m.22350 type:complete len:416 (-) Transcript_14317:223-1470(-)
MSASSEDSPSKFQLDPNGAERITNAEPKSMRALQQSMKEMGVNASAYIKTSMETLKQADGGRSIQTDEFCTTETQGLTRLHDMIERQKTNPKEKRPQKWNFATVPYQLFDKTLDDVLVAFLKWSTLEADDEDKNYEEGMTKMNISKAFRRLESYATWMDNTGRDLIDPPMDTQDDIQKSWKAWNMKLSHDKSGKLVWWMDFDTIDMETVKSLRPTDTLRLFVWMAHFIMLDDKAQKNGMVYCQNMAKVKLWTSFSLIPPKLGLKLDKLTIGVLPIKMKKLFVLESPTWMTVLLGSMKPFLSKKMRSRIVILTKPEESFNNKLNTKISTAMKSSTFLKKKQDTEEETLDQEEEDTSIMTTTSPQAVLESTLGFTCIPRGFGGMNNGALVTDIISEKYFGGIASGEELEEDEEAVDL